MKTIKSVEIVDGVKVTTYDDGSSKFEVIKQNQQEKVESRSWWQKLKDWFNTSKVTPYVKIRDLADPFGDRKEDPDDIDFGSDGKESVEIGIKVKF